MVAAGNLVAKVTVGAGAHAIVVAHNWENDHANASRIADVH